MGWIRPALHPIGFGALSGSLGGPLPQPAEAHGSGGVTARL
jgi:hypothetical protein